MQNTIAGRVGALFLAFVLQSDIVPVSADDSSANAGMPDHVAIQGYDVVSYFTDGKPIKGKSEISVPFDDSRWQFATDAHRNMFAANPDRYMPQYGGLCAGGMALGVSVPANPENWVIVDGKLYMVAGTKANLEEWKRRAAENIAAADKHWAESSGD